MWNTLSKQKKKIVIGLALCGLVAVGLWQFQWRTKVAYYEVKTETVEQLIHTDGMAVPKTSKWYLAQKEGVIGKMDLAVGDELKQNDPLYEIKETDYKKRQGTVFALFSKICEGLSSQTNLTNQETITKLKAQFSDVNRGMFNSWGAHEKVLTLFATKAVSESATKESLGQLKDEIAYYNKETGDLIAKLEKECESLSKENADMVKLRSEWTIMESMVGLMAVKTDDGKSTVEENYAIEPDKIISLEKGIVTRLGAEAGQYVLQGTPVVEVSDPSQISLEMEVPVDQIMALKSGAEVRVTGTDGAVSKGKINKIDNVITEQMQDDGNILKCVKVTASMDPNVVLKFFSTAQTTLVVQTQKDAVVVPKELVFEKDGIYTVWVNANGVLSEKVIEVSFKTETLMVVKSGIKSGDKLVMDTKLRLGQKIKF